MRWLASRGSHAACHGAGTSDPGRRSTHLCRGSVAQLNVAQRKPAQLALPLAAQPPARDARRACCAAAVAALLRAAPLQVQLQGGLQGCSLALLKRRIVSGRRASWRHPGAHHQLPHHDVGGRRGPPAGVGNHTVGSPATTEGSSAVQPRIRQAALGTLLARRCRPWRRHKALTARGCDGRGAGRQQRRQTTGRRRARRSGVACCRSTQRCDLLLPPRVAC